MFKLVKDDVKVYAEIGTLWGGSAGMILKLVNPDTELFCIDLFNGYYNKPTVANDLNKCSMSINGDNHLELVKTKGLEQQITVHPAFEVRLKEELKEETTGIPHWTSNIDAWIKENNLDQYYDFNLPMFTSGRIILGKIDMTETNKEEVIKEMVKCTKLTNVELIDE